MRTRILLASIVPVLAMAAACGGTASDGGSGGTGGTAGAGAAGAAGGSGASGMGAAAGTGGGSAAGECQKAEECVLINDCCNCNAVPVNSPPPPTCPATCEAGMCTAIGLPLEHRATCEVGRCILGHDCDQTHAYCESVPPSCPPGQAVRVSNGCWAGCVPSSECAYVPGCEACGADELCVNQNQTGYEVHCVPYPPACSGNPTSDCLCPLVCPSWNFCNAQSASYVLCEYI